MDKRRYYKEAIPVRFLIFALLAAVALFVLGYAVKFLWNYTLPDLINVKQISYWQAVALVVLSRILFGSFGRGGFRGRRRKFGPPPGLKEKLMNMSEEERKIFMEKMRGRCEK